MALGSVRAFLGIGPQVATITLLCAAVLALVHPLTWRPWLAGWVPLLYISLLWFLARYRRCSSLGKRLGRFVALIIFSLLAMATSIHHYFLAQPGLAWVNDRAVSTPYSLTEIAATVLLSATVMIVWLNWLTSAAKVRVSGAHPSQVPFEARARGVRIEVKSTAPELAVADDASLDDEQESGSQ